MRQTVLVYESTFRIVTGLFVTAIGGPLLYVSHVAGAAVLLIGVTVLLIGCVGRGIVDATFEIEARRRNGDVPK